MWVLAGVCLFASFAYSDNHVPCDVRAWTEYGWVCGLKRWSENGKTYASFRGVPYAKQPIGELRFKELQPAEPWKHDYDAREEGPKCPQHNEVYGFITNEDYGMSEACIHANIHIPIHALPKTHHEIKHKNYHWFEKQKSIEIIGYDARNYHKNEYEYSREDNKYDYTLPKYGNIDNVYRKNVEGYEYKTDEKKYEYPLRKYGNIDYEHKHHINSRLEHQKVPAESDLDVLSKIVQYDDVGEFIYNVVKDDPKQLYNMTTSQNYKTESKYNKLEDKKDSEAGLQHKIKYGEHEKLLPILVFIHGGGFNEGSGDADLHGPEYLVSKDVIVITFNYRLNVFGFLSLNTSSVPGNNGLRDQITLLRWVHRNAKYFGGDPDDITLMGQSAGAACAHLLSLSDAAKGLFKRVWLLSGTAYQSFYTTSPTYAGTVKNSFLAILGITSVDPEEIHKELIRIPIERIIEANSLLQGQYGLITFTPVVEVKFPGVTTVIYKDPDSLIAEGRGNEYPIVIGSTTHEAETFKRRLDYERYVSRAVANPRTLLPAGITYSTPPNVSFALGNRLNEKCFDALPNLDGLVKCFTEVAFVYQAFRLARQRANTHAAPTYVYRFSYISDLNLIKKGIKLNYNGVGHIEDLTYVFRVNSLLEPKSDFPPKNKDDMMKDWMTAFVYNFMICSDPTCHKNSPRSGWPHVTKDHLVFEDIYTPYEFKAKLPNNYIKYIMRFYDRIYAMSGITLPVNATMTY